MWVFFGLNPQSKQRYKEATCLIYSKQNLPHCVLDRWALALLCYTALPEGDEATEQKDRTAGGDCRQSPTAQPATPTPRRWNRVDDDLNDGSIDVHTNDVDGFCSD